MNSFKFIDSNPIRETIAEIETAIYKLNEQVEDKKTRINNIVAMTKGLENENLLKIIEQAGQKGGCAGYLAKELGYSPAEMETMLHNAEWNNQGGNVVAYFKDIQGIKVRNHVGLHENGIVKSKLNCFGATVENKVENASANYGQLVAYTNIPSKK